MFEIFLQNISLFVLWEFLRFYIHCYKISLYNPKTFWNKRTKQSMYQNRYNVINKKTKQNKKSKVY